jgi:hypothetical protein
MLLLESQWRAFLWRYGFAILCVAAPLILTIVTTRTTLDRLIPELLEFTGKNTYTFDYKPAVPKAKSATEKTKAEDAADPTMFLPARQYYGQTMYAIASAFLYTFAAGAFCFAVFIVFQRWGAIGVILGLAFFTCVVLYITDGIGIPRGRYLVVDDLLNKADGFKELQPLAQPTKAGDALRALVKLNTIVALVPVGMIMLATAALSVRACDDELDIDCLKIRLAKLRWAILLSSALLVTGVLANKAMVEWPLSLVSESQATGLRPIADALVLQMGATGTIASFGLFTPAIVAWSLDVERLRRNSRIAPTGSESKVRAGGDTTNTTDGLIVAPISTITAILAALAPVLASPFLDALKSIIGTIAK